MEIKNDPFEKHFNNLVMEYHKDNNIDDREQKLQEIVQKIDDHK
jgi:hypothetical protein